MTWMLQLEERASEVLCKRWAFIRRAYYYVSNGQNEWLMKPDQENGQDVRLSCWSGRFLLGVVAFNVPTKPSLVLRESIWFPNGLCKQFELTRSLFVHTSCSKQLEGQLACVRLLNRSSGFSLLKRKPSRLRWPNVGCRAALVMYTMMRPNEQRHRLLTRSDCSLSSWISFLAVESV